MLILKFPNDVLFISALMASLVTCSPNLGLKFLLKHLMFLGSILPIGPICSLISLKGPAITHPPPVPPIAVSIAIGSALPNIAAISGSCPPFPGEFPPFPCRNGGRPAGNPLPDERPSAATFAPFPPKPASVSNTGLDNHAPPASGASKLQSLFIEKHYFSPSTSLQTSRVCFLTPLCL